MNKKTEEFGLTILGGLAIAAALWVLAFLGVTISDLTLFLLIYIVIKVS